MHPPQLVYDYEGRRVAKTVGASVTRYYGDLAEAGDGYLTKYYYAGSLLVASRRVPNRVLAGLPPEAPIRVAQAAPGRLSLAVTLREDLQHPFALGIGVGAAGLLLAPWRRRRVVGVAVRHGHVLGVLLGFAVLSLPLPVVMRPALAQSGTLTHYHLDHLGSTQLMTGARGEVIAHLRYKPYGEVRGHYGADGQLLSASCDGAPSCREFTGYDTEPLSGLQYAGARFYDPALGMFLSFDPAREYANPYTYVGWDPMNGIDPNGECAFLCLFIIAFIIGFAVSAIQAGINGASFPQALKAGAIGGAIGGATGVGLGVVGAVVASFKSPAVSLAYNLALTGSGAYSTVQGFQNGQYLVGAVGVVMLAFGLQRLADTQGPNGPSRGPSFSRGGGQSRVLFWDEAEALYQNVSEVPPGGWETVVVDNSTAPSGAPRAYPGRIGLGGDFSMTAIPHPSDRFSTLVHEAWHVVQFGRGDWVRLGAASDWTKSWFGVDPYNPQLNRAGFGSYGIENQATLVEWNYRATYNLGAPWNSPSNFPTTPSQVLRLRGLVP